MKNLNEYMHESFEVNEAYGLSISHIPSAEINRITRFLQTRDPESAYEQRHLEEEGMSDKELQNFRDVAEYFRYGSGLSNKVRTNVGKWANLAADEQSRRRKSKKNGR